MWNLPANKLSREVFFSFHLNAETFPLTLDASRRISLIFLVIPSTFPRSRHSLASRMQFRHLEKHKIFLLFAHEHFPIPLVRIGKLTERVSATLVASKKLDF